MDRDRDRNVEVNEVGPHMVELRSGWTNNGTNVRSWFCVIIGSIMVCSIWILESELVPRVFLTLFVLVLVAMVAPNTAYRIDTENRRLVFGSVLFGWRMPALRRAIEVDGSAELVVYVVADLADGGFSHRLFLESEDRRRFLESWESMPNEKADEMVESLGAALGKVLGIKFAGYRPRPRNSWWW